MEYYMNQLCITQEELLNGIISLNNLKSLLVRNQVERLRRGCRNTPALYSVDSLPYRYKSEVYRRYPNTDEQRDGRHILDNIRIDGEALNFYFNYRFADGRHLPEDKQIEYANTASILNTLKTLLDDSDSHRIKLNKKRVSRKDFFARIADSLPRITEKYPNVLPSSSSRIARKYSDYHKDGYLALIDNRYNNRNACKVDDVLKESLMIRLISHQNNLDNTQVANYYNAIARENGYMEITPRTVGDYRERYDLETSGGRLGSSGFRNTKTMQVKRSRPTEPFLYWTLDGWDCELLYQKTTENRHGHRTTTYSNRLVLEVVLDPFNNYPIGYAIGDVENASLISEALCNALKHSKELFGEMYRPRQLQADNFAKKAMTDIYRAVGEVVTPARVKNAKSKVIEPYFKYLNKTYCQHCSNWSGFGITSDKSKQPNSEALNLMRKSFPDRDGLVMQIHEMMSRERSAKHKEFMAHINMSSQLVMSMEMYLAVFGKDNGYRNTLSHSGLRVSINGERKDYESFDIAFRKLSHIKWTVKYDPSDTSEVLAVSEDGTHRFILEEKYTQPMALSDRKTGDAAELKRIDDFNRSLESHVSETVNKAVTTTDKLLESLSWKNGLLDRHAICDSRGQHKLRRYEERNTEMQEDDDTDTDEPIQSRYDLF